MSTLFNRLAIKIGIGLVIIQVIAFTIVGFFYVNRFNTEVEQRLTERIVIPGTLMNNGELQLDSIADDSLMQNLVGEDLTQGLVIGANNNVFFSRNPELVGQSISNLPDIDQALLSTQLNEPIVVRNEDQIISVSPIFASDGITVRFYVYIGATTVTSSAQQQEVVNLFVVSLLLTLIVTSTVFLITVDRIVLQRISHLSDTAQKIEAGHLDTRADEGTGDELGMFAQSFNHMASQLQVLLSTLEERVAVRTRDLELSSKVARQVTTELNIDRLLPQLAEETQKTFDYLA